MSCPPAENIGDGGSESVAKKCRAIKTCPTVTLLTTNRTYRQWAGTFNDDATLTSALLDRLLDHVETVLIEGKS